MENHLRFFYGYLLLLGLLLLSFLFEPCLIICGNGQRIAETPAIPGTCFSIQFLHSVQRTPVRENLMVEEGGFRLDSTEYQSFGVGLPFLEDEGDFRMEGDRFLLEHMNRRFSRLSLRTGTGTMHRIFLHGKEYRLYEMFPPGTQIDIVITSFYKIVPVSQKERK